MPSAFSLAANKATAGLALGASWVTYAAVVGGWPAGRLAIQLTNWSGRLVVVPGWAKKRSVKPRVNRVAAPPDGSTYSMPWRAAIAEAGAFSRLGKGPGSQ